MTDGWEPPSEAECQACWDGLKAKLAAVDILTTNQEATIGDLNDRIAELEAEIQHLNEAQVRQVIGLQAEVKRLTADVKRACAMVGLGRNMDALILLSRMVNSSKPSGDAKRDPISPRDPLERV